MPTEPEFWLILFWLIWLLGTQWIVLRPTLSPPALGLMLIMLIYVLVPATAAVLNGHTQIARADYTPGTTGALQVSVAAQISILAGFILFHLMRRGDTRLRQVTIQVSPKRLTSVALAIGLLGAIAFGLVVATVSADLSKYVALLGSSSYGDFYASASGTPSGYLSSLTGIVGVLIMLAIAARTANVSSRRTFAVTVLAVVAAFFLVSSGVRVRFVVPLVAAGLLWIKIRRRAKPLPIRRLTAIATIGLLAFSALVGVLRVQNTQLTALAFVSAAGSDLFSPLAGLVETVPAYQDYLGGSSYLEAVYFPIPRALWPNKPQGSIIAVTAQFSDVRNGESFPEYGEMFANFGIAGVIIGCILFGALLEWMWSRFAANTGRSGLFVYPALIAIALQLYTRDYAVSQMAGLLGFVLGAILVQRALRFEVLQRTSGSPTGVTAAQQSVTQAHASAHGGLR